MHNNNTDHIVTIYQALFWCLVYINLFSPDDWIGIILALVYRWENQSEVTQNQHPGSRVQPRNHHTTLPRQHPHSTGEPLLREERGYIGLPSLNLSGSWSDGVILQKGTNWTQAHKCTICEPPTWTIAVFVRPFLKYLWGFVRAPAVLVTVETGQQNIFISVHLAKPQCLLCVITDHKMAEDQLLYLRAFVLKEKE